MPSKPPKRRDRKAAVRTPAARETDQLLGDSYSAQLFEVRDCQNRPRFAKVYLDVVTSPEFAGSEVTRRESDGVVRTVKVGGLGIGAVKCYLYIGNHTSGRSGIGDHPWSLSVDKMAKALALSRATAYRAIDQLKKAGFLEVVKRPGRPSIYNLTLPPSLRGSPSFPINGKNDDLAVPTKVSEMRRVSLRNETGKSHLVRHPYREETEKITNNSSEDVICDHDNSHLATTTGTESDARRAAAAMQRDALEGNRDSVLPGQLSLVDKFSVSVASSETDTDPLTARTVLTHGLEASRERQNQWTHRRATRAKPSRKEQEINKHFDKWEEQLRDPSMAKGFNAIGLTLESIAEKRAKALEHLKERGE